jgi:coagulation factor 10
MYIADNENVATRKRRFTRASTLPTTTAEAVSEVSEIDQQPEVAKEIEVSLVAAPATETGPSIQVAISSKKSLRVRNCGERIGDDVPFIALLVHTNPYEEETRKRTLSKGVLISEKFVLTTVSSVYHSESFWTVSSVRLGDFATWNKYANRDKSYSVEIEVDEIFLHKKRDIALIKLKDAVTFTDVIRPACLPQSDSYNFKELKSHLCKRAQHPKTPADVTLEFAVSISAPPRPGICKIKS